MIGNRKAFLSIPTIKATKFIIYVKPNKRNDSKKNSVAELNFSGCFQLSFSPPFRISEANPVIPTNTGSPGVSRGLCFGGPDELGLKLVHSGTEKRKRIKRKTGPCEEQPVSRNLQNSVV